MDVRSADEGLLLLASDLYCLVVKVQTASVEMTVFDGVKAVRMLSQLVTEAGASRKEWMGRNGEYLWVRPAQFSKFIESDGSSIAL